MLSVLDHVGVSGAYFFPRKASFRPVTQIEVGNVTTPDGLTSSISLSCHVGDLDPDRLTLLHFHGNGETVADYAGTDFHDFGRLDANVVFVEYRGYGESSGEPTLVGMLSDGEDIIRALGLSFDRVVAFGRSIGPLYAIELAARQPTLAGLIIESGIADPCERFLKYADFDLTGSTEQEVRDEAARWFDHAAKLSQYRNPFLLLHTERDGLIDITHAERNLAWSASPRKKLVRFPLGNHNTIMPYNRVEYFSEVRSLLLSVQ